MRRLIKESNVVGNAAGQQCIFLHDHADFAAYIGQAQLLNGYATIQNDTVGGSHKSQHDLEQAGFAATTGACDGHMLASLNAQVEVLKEPGLGVGVTKRNIAKFKAG